MIASLKNELIHSVVLKNATRYIGPESAEKFIRQVAEEILSVGDTFILFDQEQVYTPLLETLGFAKVSLPGDLESQLAESPQGLAHYFQYGDGEDEDLLFYFPHAFTVMVKQAPPREEAAKPLGTTKRTARQRSRKAGGVWVGKYGRRLGFDADAWFSRLPPFLQKMWIKRQRDSAARHMLSFILEEGELPPISGISPASLERARHWRTVFEPHAGQPEELLSTAHVQGFDRLHLPNAEDEQAATVFSKTVSSSGEAHVIVAWRTPAVASEASPAKDIQVIRSDYIWDHYYEILDAETGRILQRSAGYFLATNGFSLSVAAGPTVLLIRDVGEMSRWGHSSQHVLSEAGVMVAARSYNEPPYGFDWRRDWALFMKALSHIRMNGDHRISTKDLEHKLSNMVAYAFRLFAKTPVEEWGDAKRQVDGKRYVSTNWSNPQHDGPALTATALVDYAITLNQTHPGEETQRWIREEAFPLVSRLLREYTIHHIHDRGYDLWEEKLGYHFYTRMSEYRALRKGVFLANQLGIAPPPEWAQTEQEIRKLIERDELYIRANISGDHRPATLGELMKRAQGRFDLHLPEAVSPRVEDLIDTILKQGSKPGFNREEIQLWIELLVTLKLREELRALHGDDFLRDYKVLVSNFGPDSGKGTLSGVWDSSVLLAITHNLEETESGDEMLAADDPLVMMTLDAQERIFRDLYPINRQNQSPERGIGIGRYPGDVYDGGSEPGRYYGNPWYLTTSGFGRIRFALARAMAQHAQTPEEWNLYISAENRRTANQALFGVPAISYENARALAIDPTIEKAKGYVRWIRRHMRDGELMSEQVDAKTGQPRGAHGLAWSYREWNRLLNDWLRSFENFPTPYSGFGGRQKKSEAQKGVPPPDSSSTSHAFRALQRAA